MELRRRLSRVQTLTQFNFSYNKSFGHKFRDFIAKSGHHVKPIQKYIFPNFIAVHYFYIIFMTILASILLYPVKNFSYIDILFLAAGATTQGGLNTVNINELTLYQQMIIYIICCLCTPIAIHGTLAFVRLYWFERYFDNIRDTSKRNYKMRRTKTILEREKTARTLSRLRTNTTIPIHKSNQENSQRSNFQEKLFSGEFVNRDEQNSIESQQDAMDSQSTQNSLPTFKGLGPSKIQKTASPRSLNSTLPSGSVLEDGESRTPYEQPIDYTIPNSNPNLTVPVERFKRRRSRDISPQDMYRSIMMLQDKHSNIDDNEEGPALVIGSPQDRQNIKPTVQSQSMGHNALTPVHSISDKEVSPKHVDANEINMGMKVKDKHVNQGPSRRSGSQSPSSENAFPNENDEEENFSPYTNSRKIKLNKHPTGRNYDNSSDDLNSAGNYNSEEGLESENATQSTEEVSPLDSDDAYSDGDSHEYENTEVNEDSDSIQDIQSGNNRLYRRRTDQERNLDYESEASITQDNIERHNNDSINSENAASDDSESNGENTNDRNARTPNKGGEPKIQFNITEPPRKRRTQNFHIMEATRPNIPHNAHKRTSSNLFLKQLSKGKRIRHNLKRRLSSGPFEKNESPFNPSIKNVNKQKGSQKETNQDNGEDYFADNESDDDDNNPASSDYNGLSKTVSYNNTEDRKPDPVRLTMERAMTMDNITPEDLNKLAQKPDFQKMVYKNWKRKHRKNKKNRKLGWNKKFDFEDTLPTVFDSHNEGHQRTMSNDEDNEDIRNGNIDRYNTIDYNDGYQIDPDMNEEGYFDVSFNNDYNFSRHPFSRTMSANYLSWEPTVGRNSLFVDLSRAQKEELGGVEYRSIKLLCKILVIYYLGFHIMSFTMLLPWITHKTKYKHIVRDDGVSPGWWGFFTAMSAFNDLGLTLTPDSMSSFNRAAYPLIVMIWFIIIGNTGFPVLLRFIIWVMYHLSSDLSQLRESLAFLLDHPRRCFTLLFPSTATWWLFGILVGLNITDWILFIILDFNNVVVKPNPKGYRVLMGLFQAVSTRTAGFSVVDLSQLNSAVQVSYMIMMYVSVLPLAISIRRTNVYEEQSLGLYGNVEDDDSSDSDYEDHLSSEEELLAKNGDNDDDEETLDSQYYSKSIRGRNDSDESSSNEGGSNSSAKKRKRTAKKESSKGKKKKRRVSEKKSKSFIGAHLRRQLSFDLWFLFLGLFVICICENGKIKDVARPAFNVFPILFEIVSAYGTVGLSLGYPNTSQSLSGQFTTLSKLVIIAMLIRGRNRGLPYTLDRAIILPSDRLERIDHIEDLKLKRTAGLHARHQPRPEDERKKSIAKKSFKYIKKGGKGLLYPSKLL
ncbi:Cation transport protein [Nakaseomyces glabratus]